jgi:hypothetical protein
MLVGFGDLPVIVLQYVRVAQIVAQMLPSASIVAMMPKKVFGMSTDEK